MPKIKIDSDTPLTDALAEAIKEPMKLGKLTIAVESWLNDNPPESIAKFQLGRVVVDLVNLRRAMEHWFQLKTRTVLEN